MPFSEVLTGLTTGTTYYFCAIASNSIGTGFGTLLSFTTTGAPIVTTNAASAVTSTGATLNGSANPNARRGHGLVPLRHDQPGHLRRRLRHARAGGRRHGARRRRSRGRVRAGDRRAYARDHLLLLRHRLELGGHELRLRAVVHDGVGADRHDDAATSVTSSGATLNGSANPNLLTATGWFRYSTIDPGELQRHLRHARAGGRRHRARRRRRAPCRTRRPSRASRPATTYYFCAIASNAAGTTFGAVLSFTTAGPPQVRTLAARR